MLLVWDKRKDRRTWKEQKCSYAGRLLQAKAVETGAGDDMGGVDLRGTENQRREGRTDGLSL